jgi:hypothetical protein
MRGRVVPKALRADSTAQGPYRRSDRLRPAQMSEWRTACVIAPCPPELLPNTPRRSEAATAETLFDRRQRFVRKRSDRQMPRATASGDGDCMGEKRPANAATEPDGHHEELGKIQSTDASLGASATTPATDLPAFATQTLPAAISSGLTSSAARASAMEGGVVALDLASSGRRDQIMQLPPPAVRAGSALQDKPKDRRAKAVIAPFPTGRYH